MLLIVGTIRLPAERLAEAIPAMKCMIESSRAEDGCEAYSYSEDVLDRGLIHVMEMWRDQVALDRHFSSEHIAAWRSVWSRLAIRDRNLRLYTVSDSREA